ncbi:MAG: UDP-2,3-diacylglucosamine diphosphatase [bacterium]
MEKTIYFISDIHLGFAGKEIENNKEQKLISFIKNICKDADKLYILGDLFDFWFEYKYVAQKGYFELFTVLKELTSNGIEVNYLIGNHDFLHKNFFSEYLNVNIIDKEIEVVLNNKKFFLGHGDGLVKKDTGYKILKKVLRNKTIQFLYSLLHPDLGIWLAKNTSKKSRDFTKEKNYGEIDGLFETAKQKIELGSDYVIFGHSHKREMRTYKSGTYINLGSWMEKPCYGKFTENNFEIIDW